MIVDRVQRLGFAALGLLCMTSASCVDREPPRAEPRPRDPDMRIVGRANVIDGDTLEVRGRRVRLWGIDAPESDQQCRHADGRAWHCGAQAANALSQWLGARSVNCEPKGRSHDRVVARCRVNGHDVAEWMVRKGWALDYRQHSDGAYARAQRAAIDKRLGLHDGAFQAPWDYRRTQRGERR